MRDILKTALGKQITLPDGSKYLYVVSQAEVFNAVGAVAAILDEYIITDEVGNTYKLYKTKEGNWYDLTDENNSPIHAILQRLKRAIDDYVDHISE